MVIGFNQKKAPAISIAKPSIAAFVVSGHLTEDGARRKDKGPRLNSYDPLLLKACAIGEFFGCAIGAIYPKTPRVIVCSSHTETLNAYTDLFSSFGMHFH